MGRWTTAALLLPVALCRPQDFEEMNLLFDDDFNIGDEDVASSAFETFDSDAFTQELSEAQFEQKKLRENTYKDYVPPEHPKKELNLENDVYEATVPDPENPMVNKTIEIRERHPLPVELIAAGQQIFSEFPLTIDYDEITNHGCWCSKFGLGFGAGGDPVDELDEICRQWFYARRCVMLPGGRCETGFSAETYNIKYENKIHKRCQDSSKPGMNCLYHLCVIDAHFSWSIYNMFRNRDANGLEIVRDAKCNPISVQPHDKICIGYYPDRLTAMRQPKTSQCSPAEVTAPQNICAALLSRPISNKQIKKNKHMQGNDILWIYEGSGSIPDTQGKFGTVIKGTVSAFVQRKGCKLTLYERDDCVGFPFTFNDCGSYFTQSNDVCASVGSSFDNRAKQYRCDCVDSVDIITDLNYDPFV